MREPRRGCVGRGPLTSLSTAWSLSARASRSRSLGCDRRATRCSCCTAGRRSRVPAPAPSCGSECSCSPFQRCDSDGVLQLSGLRETSENSDRPAVPDSAPPALTTTTVRIIQSPVNARPVISLFSRNGGKTARLDVLTLGNNTGYRRISERATICWWPGNAWSERKFSH